LLKMHHNVSCGYFILSQDGHRNELASFTESDVSTMERPYISLKSIRTKGFSPVDMPAMRSHTHKGGGPHRLGAQGIQDGSGKNAALSEPAGIPHIQTSGMILAAS